MEWLKKLSWKRKVASLSVQARRSFYISVGLHLLLLFAAGVMVISHVFFNRESTFVGQPAPMKTYEPRKLEHQVKVQKRQRSSSRPSIAPRMVAMKPSDFALPEIKVDAKVVKTSFQPKFKQFTGVGFGAGLGTGFGLGGFGLGVSQFDFFGIKGRGDRIAILVDVSESMAEDEKGGEKGYARVKDKLGQVVDALNEQALFNVIAFADAGRTFKPDMVAASTSNKRAAKEFLQPFNTGGNWGMSNGNVQQSNLGLHALGGTTRLDLALTAAFEQGADTILIISDGEPRVQKEIPAEQRAAWDARISQWREANAGAIAAHAQAMQAFNAQQAQTPTRQVKVWVPPRPRREGQAAVEGHFEMRTVHEGGAHAPAGPQAPQMPDSMNWWTLDDFLTHFRMLHEGLYLKKGKKLPIVHCIGYSIDPKGGDFLKALTRTYKGQYRRIGNAS